jgi:lysophospholipase L1-like esterase
MTAAMENAAGITVIAGVAMLLASAPAFAGAQVRCTAPTSVVRLNAALPNTARAIRHGEAVMIVAIGSSSTQGVGASDKAHSYPAVLADELRRRWPRLAVTVVNKGVGGQTADQMLARFGTDVMPYRPQLVIWQTGSNSTLKGTAIESYAATLRSGLRRLRAARIDVVLMDPQYAPKVIAKPLHQRMIAALGAAANDFRVAVFHRYAVMRHWVTSGERRMEDVVSRDRLHMNDASYGCIARLLADALDAAARATPPETIVETAPAMKRETIATAPAATPVTP